MGLLEIKIFFTAVFGLFLAGAAAIVWDYFKNKNQQNFWPLFLLFLFCVPFSLYLTTGLFQIKFGWARNFFYLLPLYLLISLWGLKKITFNKYLFYPCAGLVLFGMFHFGLIGVACWETNNLARCLAQQAAQIKSKLVIINAERDIDSRPIWYYLKKFHNSNPVAIIYKEPLFQKIKMPYPSQLVVMEGSYSPPQENFYFLDQKKIKIDRVLIEQPPIGPFFLLKKLRNIPEPKIIVYFCHQP